MSFRLRLCLTISILIAITFSLGGTVLIAASFQASINKETSAALDSFKTIQNTLYLLNSLGEKTDYQTLSEALTQMQKQGVSHWQALSLTSGDETLYQDGEESMLTSSLPMPASDHCVYTLIQDDYGYGMQMLSILSSTDAQLKLTMRFDLSSAYETRAAQLQLYCLIYLFVALLGIVTSISLSFAFTKRLQTLTRTVRQIAGGDLSTRSNLSSKDEFGQLSRDFDAMADRLEETICHLESDVQRQETFMGNLAHELKTPMTSIIGYSDLLRQDALDDDTRIMAASYIFSEGKRLENLSFKLLNLLLLKKDTLVLQPVPLAAYIRNIVSMLSPDLQKRSIQLRCKAQRGTVYIEPDLVQSLLYNLIDNAAKAIDESGLITVTASLLPDGCQLQVADTGRGMEKAELSKITDAFYRIDKSRARSLGGAGLGLSLCKEIAALHGGSLHFDSTPGEGTVVTVILYRNGGTAHAKI